jgi:L-ascorbate metabolism protein UlaG (beta-lactamase superfamily)
VSEGVRTTFINHATLLIQLDGVNIVTDPIWSGRCSPVSWAGPRRHRQPGIRFDDLPPIDVVLLSHNHYDHVDLPTLRRLSSRDRPLILAGAGNRRLLEQAGLDTNVIELDWWQTTTAVRPLELHFVPARHFSARAVCDRNATLWGGWVIEGPSGRVYFAGDTGWGEHFAEIRERYGAPDVAMLPVGAFRPEWFMSPVHIGPDDAIRAHQALGAATTIPMHYGTFFLGDDGEMEAVDKLGRAVAERGLEKEFAILGFGESFSTPGR